MWSGIVTSFRRGRHTVTTNQIIIEVTGITNRKDASRLIGKKVVYTTESGKKLVGVVTSPHGNGGKVRARFKKGLPGQIVGKRVVII